MSQYSDSAFAEDLNTSWSKTFALIKEGSVVIDVGCSSGIFGAELIAKKKCIVDGIEIDDGDFIKAQQKLRKVYKLNIETDNLNIDTKYDVIFMGDVIEHLAKPVQALHKLRGLLKDGGELVFSIPNITHMSVRLMLLEGKIEYGKTGLLDETHLHFYNKEEIYRIFNEAGYKIEEFGYTINDAPFDLVKTKLAAIGLMPNKQFKELLNSVDAVAYQFIGTAIRSDVHKRQPIPQSSPKNIVGEYIEELKGDYIDAIEDLKLNLKKTAEDRNRIILDRDRIQTQLNKYKHPIRHATRRAVRYGKQLAPGKKKK